MLHSLYEQYKIQYENLVCKEMKIFTLYYTLTYCNSVGVINGMPCSD